MKNYYIDNLKAGIYKILSEDKSAFILGEDIHDPYGGAFKVTSGLSAEFPDNVLHTPMSEQGFTGMGIGMALAGMKVMVEIMFGDFITLCADQMINHALKFVGLYRKKLRFVIRTPMGGYRGYGATHSQSLEKIFMGFPDIQVVSPSILHDPGLLLEKSLNKGIPTLFVENKLDYTRAMFSHTKSAEIFEIFESKDEFPIVKLNFEGENETDIVIVSYGGLIAPLCEGIESLFLEDEISVHLISPSLIYPIQVKLIEMLDNYKHIIVIEEGYSGASWCSEVVLNLVKQGVNSRIHVYSAKNEIIGASENLEISTLPNISQIMEKIKELADE